MRPRKQRLASVSHGYIDPDWLDLARSGERRAAFPEAHAFLIDNATEDTAPPASADWLMIDGHADAYYHVGWRIRQRRPWPRADIQRALDRITAERIKGLFATEVGWQACNQAEWTALDAPRDGLARLEIIDPERPDAAAIERALRRLDGGQGDT